MIPFDKILQTVRYLPSFMSRYYLQLIILILPWLLQNNHVSLGYISNIFSIFFIGSLSSTIVFSFFDHKINNKRCLYHAAWIQTIAMILCFYIKTPVDILVLRFIQGFGNGIFRPMNRIWLQNTLDSNDYAKTQAKVSSNGQAFIAIGMCIGSISGVLVVITSANKFITALCVIIPLLLVVISIMMVKTKILSISNNVEFNAKKIINFFKVSKYSLMALVTYTLSLSVFKIWIIGVPYDMRSHGYSSLLIALMFILQSLCYGITQLSLNNYNKFMMTDQKMGIIIICISTIAQGLLTSLSLYFNNRYFICLIILVGGGLLPALIYPQMILIIMKDCSSPKYFFLKGKLFFILAISADAGQLLGSLCLIRPNVFDIKLGIIYIPITICFLVLTYVYRSKSKVF